MYKNVSWDLGMRENTELEIAPSTSSTWKDTLANFLPLVLVILMVFAGLMLSDKHKKDVEIEAIKAGLHQEMVDGKPIWVKE